MDKLIRDVRAEHSQLKIDVICILRESAERPFVNHQHHPKPFKLAFPTKQKTPLLFLKETGFLFSRHASLNKVIWSVQIYFKIRGMCLTIYHD